MVIESGDARNHALEAGAALAVDGIVIAAPAIPPPVADGASDLGQLRPIGVDRPALAHRDVVGRVEAERRHLTERAHHAAVPLRPQRVARIFQQKEIMPPDEVHHRVHIGRVAQRVGKDQRARARRHRLLQLRHVQVKVTQTAVDEYRRQTVLNDGIDGSGEADGWGDNLVAGAQTLRQLARTQRRHGHQVGRRAGVDRHDFAHADKGAQLLLELLGIWAGSEPEIEHGADHVLNLRLIVDATGVVYGCLARLERPVMVSFFVVVGNLVQNRLPQLFDITHAEFSRSRRRFAERRRL